MSDWQKEEKRCIIFFTVMGIVLLIFSIVIFIFAVMAPMPQGLIVVSIGSIALIAGFTTLYTAKNEKKSMAKWEEYSKSHIDPYDLP